MEQRNNGTMELEGQNKSMTDTLTSYVGKGNTYSPFYYHFIILFSFFLFGFGHGNYGNMETHGQIRNSILEQEKK